MTTSSALRSVCRHGERTVTSVGALTAAGWSTSAIRHQIRARRWQRIGRAVVRHNGPLQRGEQLDVALVNAGPRSALTAFTALEDWGLTGWPRDDIHVLVPRGARVTPIAGVRLHYTDDRAGGRINELRRLHRPAGASIRAASTFATPRPACGILAATVQQRLVRADDLVEAVTRATRVRHRRTLLAAAHDIAQGAQALSEIDFARLCRSACLPAPTRQAVRAERSGRRRYLDAEWRLPGVRRVVVEVDGALHLAATRWWDDQLRQNELVLTGDLVLRYPSVVIRCEPALVLAQLTRALTNG